MYEMDNGKGWGAAAKSGSQPATAAAASHPTPAVADAAPVAITCKQAPRTIRQRGKGERRPRPRPCGLGESVLPRMGGSGHTHPRGSG